MMPRIIFRRDHLLSTLLVMLWVGMHTALYLQYGVRDLVDAHRYSVKADFLLSHGRLQEASDLFYIVHIGLLALFKIAFHSPIIPFIVVQCILSGLATLALYKASSKLFDSGLAGFFTAAIFLLWIDHLQWNLVTLTESLACSVACFMLYALVHFDGKAKSLLILAFLLVLNLFIRPTGLVALGGALGFVIFYYRSWWKTSPLTMIVCGVLMVIFGVWMGLTLLDQWDFTDQHVRGNIVTYMDTLNGGPLYEESLRLDTTDIVYPRHISSNGIKLLLFFYDNPMLSAKAGFLKVYYLITAVRPYYSAWHNALIAAWMLMVYFFFIVGWSKVKGSPVVYFVSTVMVLNCALIAISAVDWDNRFFVPMEPGIVLLAGGGMDFFRKWWVGRRSGVLLL